MRSILPGYAVALIKVAIYRRVPFPGRAGLLAILTLCSLTFNVPTSALPVSKSIREFRHSSWTSRDGAPSASADWASIVQDDVGYLWLRSGVGLTRFDGTHFTSINLPEELHDSSDSITVIFAPSSGGIWAGLLFGGAIRYKDGVFTCYSSNEGFPPGTPDSFVEAPDGVIWALAGRQLARFDGQKWHTLDFGEGNGPPPTTRRVAIDSESRIWAYAQDDGLYTKALNEPGFQRVPNVNLQGNVAFAESAGGALWVSDNNFVQLVHQSKGRGKSTHSGTGLMFDHDGALWIGGISGFHRLASPDATPPFHSIEIATISDRFDSKAGLTSDIIFNSCEDREGNVWGFTSNGLDRFSNDSLVLELGSNSRLHTSKVFQPMLIPDGSQVWTALYNPNARESRETIARIDHGKIIEEHSATYTGAGIRTKEGEIIVATADELLGFKSSTLTHIPIPSPSTKSSGGYVQAIAQDQAGKLWLSIARKGVFAFIGDQWVENGGVDTLPHEPAIIVSSDSRGRIWLGYTRNRVAVVEGDGANFYTTAGLGNVLSFYGLRSRLWAGGAFGLAVLDGNTFRTVPLKGPLAFGAITGIVETSNGDLWLNGSRGIAHILASELALNSKDHTHELVSELRGIADGISGLEQRLRPLPTLVETDDHILWFSTGTEIYSIDPAYNYQNTIPPAVIIEAIDLDGTIYVASNGRVELPIYTKRLRIDFTGLSLTRPEKVRFRYRLDGVDDRWQEELARNQVFYTNLGPGPHVFRVTAANNDGVWNTEGATLTVYIKPAFYQRVWFLCALAAAGVLLLFGVYRLRINQIAQTLKAQQNVRLAERDRIARELHDTLLQSTEGLILKVHGAVSHLPSNDQTRVTLERSLDRASELASEGRDRIFDLRAHHAKRSELSQALKAVAQEIAHEYPIGLQVNVNGRVRPLIPVVWDEIYRIAREALWNSFRYSHARCITISVYYRDRDLCVLVNDDGMGFDIGQIKEREVSGHFGIAGIRERAKYVNAALDIRSSQGHGTTIELSIAAKLAYAQDR